MMPRSQLYALAVLLVALGVALVAVNSLDVQTQVFSNEPTPVPTSTVTPTATSYPQPALDNWPSADNWTEASPGQLTYTADPSKQAQITYQTISLESLIEQLQLATPSDDARLPGLSVLGQVRALQEAQIAEAELDVPENPFAGPDIEVIGAVPVVSLRRNFLVDQNSGQVIEGLNILSLIHQQDPALLMLVSFTQPGPADLFVEADYRAWMGANIAMLVGPSPAEQTQTPQAATEAAATEAATTPAATATEAATAEATATRQITPEATATRQPTATENATPRATATRRATATAEATPEATATTAGSETGN
jgi:hypothetical protein